MTLAEYKIRKIGVYKAAELCDITPQGLYLVLKEKNLKLKTAIKFKNKLGIEMEDWFEEIKLEE